MSHPIIEVNNLSKMYSIGHEDQVDRNSLQETLNRAIRKPLGLFGSHKLTREEFWALNHVSFSIERGDVVGIIGRNGSGKSTLLKTLSRIIEPTSGEAILRGTTASLLEVGTGFHPELTGRENIYFNGSILGMSRREIQAKFGEIVEFSGIERFLDTPVKFYSSGMYVRLAFAVAAHLEPDVLIVDEVLAVGDAEFQKKSLGKMQDVTKNDDRTVLFVSHSMSAIQTICNKVIWLQDGQIKAMGPTAEVVEHYTSQAYGNEGISLKNRKDRQGSGRVQLQAVQVAVEKEFKRSRTFDITLHSSTKKTLEGVKLSMDIKDSLGNHVSNLTNTDAGQELDLKPGQNHLTLQIEELNLVPGSYHADLFVAADAFNTEIFDWVEGATSFDVPEYDFYQTGGFPTIKGKFVYLNFSVTSKQ